MRRPRRIAQSRLEVAVSHQLSAVSFSPSPPPPRRGSALIIVLIVVVLLTLGAYTFFDTMILERRAADFTARTAQSRALADSGIEFAAAKLGAPADLESENLYHDPAIYAGVTLLESSSNTDRGRFTLVAPLENDATGTRLRYGLVDESSKINVNTITSLKLEDTAAHTLLMSVPGMTDEAADGILDWVDSDSTEREFGAETLSYESFDPPYAARNGAFESFDELLLVKGVTPELLYGEDTNRNGLLDANENDGDVTAPPDNEDGVLSLGWSAYLTIYSVESNLKPDGTERIDLNQALLTELYDELETAHGTAIATFVTAFRLKGPVTPSTIAGWNSATTGDASTDEALKSVANGLASQITRAATGTGGGSDGAGGTGLQATRGGMDLTAGAKTSIVSLYELVDAQVTVAINGKDTTLDSPWSTSGGNLSATLPTLLEEMSTTSAATINGRINVNQARREILLGLPDMPPDLPDQIASRQLVSSDGLPMTDLITQRATTGWLLIDGLVDLPTMQKLDKYLCARGDVFSVQSIGCFDRGGATTRIEAVIDATKKPAAVIVRRDLTRLGPGYRLDQLIPATVAP
ncbi:MAG: type II secretion system protein GspK [Planctomycetaceae bacterium]